MQTPRERWTGQSSEPAPHGSSSNAESTARTAAGAAAHKTIRRDRRSQTRAMSFTVTSVVQPYPFHLHTARLSGSRAAGAVCTAKAVVRFEPIDWPLTPTEQMDHSYTTQGMWSR
jgi:hypothetical protein